MKTQFSMNKIWKSSMMISVGLAFVSVLSMSGCGGGGGDSTLLPSSSTCEVPTEASLNTVERIGGAVTIVDTLSNDDVEFTLFNIANELRITEIGTQTAYSIEVDGFIHDVKVVAPEGPYRYALVAMGDEGVAVVNITNPALMTVVTSLKVNYDHSGIAWVEGSGTITLDNNISSKRAPITSLEVFNDGTQLQVLIGDEAYGLHKTSLDNLLGSVAEDDGTLKIDQEVYTLQYAGETPWGGPKNLTMYGAGMNARLFVAQGFMGMGIYNPVTLEKVGYYNLYTDATENNGGEDWFIDMNVADEVKNNYVDACTGMPDYNQANFEIVDVWGTGDTTTPTPWADFDKYGKYYYDARNVDLATFDVGSDGNETKTIAYIAYGLGGMVAVDVTGYDTATPRDENCTVIANFLTPKYLGYVPGVPANGTEDLIGANPDSLYPAFGSGILEEAGVVDVEVDKDSNQVYFTDHFAGLVVIGDANDTSTWHGPVEGLPYTGNDTNDDLGDHLPDYEFVTSYNMLPISDVDEAMPAFLYESPILLVTGEVSGHGYSFALTDSFDPNSTGSVDVLMTAGGGGLSFLDVFVNSETSDLNYTVDFHIATTDEIGAAADGSTEEINIGHTEGVNSYGNLVFLADGPHGMTVWEIANNACIPTDDVRLVANTLQSESTVLDVNPTPHAYDVILDEANDAVLVMSQSLGVRRLNVSEEFQVGTPLLLAPDASDIYEHNDASSETIVDDFSLMQDHAYSVAIKGTLAFTADGGNGLTVYDLSKDPSDVNSSYIISNLGNLGSVTGIALWDDLSTGKSYAITASGSSGIGVIDISDVNDMKKINLFEPKKVEIILEGSNYGTADGKSIAVKIVGEYAYFTYDSFGVVNYKITDLIKPIVDDASRPSVASRFNLQDVNFFGSAEFTDWSGGAVGMDVVSVGGKILFYIAYGEAGVIKIDWTDPSYPYLMDHINTVGSALDVTVENGRVYVADSAGGMALIK